VAAFASRIVSADPQAAVQWAATISDAIMRDTETVAALQAWFEADPTNASGWIANAGLPDQIKARFLPPQD
jgi:ferric-dicitrate binding protein FerR (iron transport regulator)